jgi:hypothetical protein
MAEIFKKTDGSGGKSRSSIYDDMLGEKKEKDKVMDVIAKLDSLIKTKS